MKLPGLASARKQARMTQAELAERLQLQRETIARYEIGDRDPSSETLVRLAEVLGVTVDALLRPEQPMPAAQAEVPQP